MKKNKIKSFIYAMVASVMIMGTAFALSHYANNLIPEVQAGCVTPDCA